MKQQEELLRIFNNELSELLGKVFLHYNDDEIIPEEQNFLKKILFLGTRNKEKKVTMIRSIDEEMTKMVIYFSIFTNNLFKFKKYLEDDSEKDFMSTDTGQRIFLQILCIICVFTIIYDKKNAITILSADRTFHTGSKSLLTILTDFSREISIAKLSRIKNISNEREYTNQKNPLDDLFKEALVSFLKDIRHFIFKNEYHIQWEKTDEVLLGQFWKVK
jgi:hypothetical protein